MVANVMGLSDLFTVYQVIINGVIFKKLIVLHFYIFFQIVLEPEIS